MAYQELVGRFYLPAYQFTVNATAKTCTAGHYWARGYSGETTDFLSHIEDLIQTVYAGASMSYSNSTGRVTIAFGTTGSITWTDTTLRDWLGFTANISSVTSATATHPLRGIWRPTRTIGRFPQSSEVANIYIPESKSIIRRSANGTTYGWEGNTLYHSSLGWDYLPFSDVISPDSGNDRTLQDWFNFIVSAAQPFRYYPDRTLNTSGSFVTMISQPNDGDRVGTFESFRSRNIESYNGYWSITIPTFKFIDPEA